VEMPANEVVKKNNKYEMSRTFFIFFSIPNDLFFRRILHIPELWGFYNKWELLGVPLTL